MYEARLLPELLLDQPLPPSRPRLLDRRVEPGLLVGGLVAFLGLDMLLLWRFVAFAPTIAYPIGAVVVAVLAVASGRRMRGFGDGPTARTVLVCLACAVLLFLLGGEGRVFYANVDWQVRDGVLHDMANHPWPYAYTARGLPEMLRAPLGMYLVPALATGVGGQAVGDWVLLAQNSLLLAAILALCAPLFATPARRAVGLAVFLVFSGMDIVGALMTYAPHGVPVPDHLEWWSGLQYSSHITQAFWVPQHALAGWACAAGYLLWQDRRMPLGVFLLLVPLTTLWSPLAAMGAMPFALLAGCQALARREIRIPDLALPATASLLAVPALLYLGAAGDTVGFHSVRLGASSYLLFVLCEVVPYMFVVLTARCRQRFGWPATVVTCGALMLIPFWQIGWSADFMMRASIPALAILSVMTADLPMTEPRRDRRILIGLILAVGSVTGLHEIGRAITWPASPPPLCSFYGAWGPSPASEKSTYLAAVERLPAAIRPHAVTLVANHDPDRCWAGPWQRPTGA